MLSLLTTRVVCRVHWQIQKSLTDQDTCVHAGSKSWPKLLVRPWLTLQLTSPGIQDEQRSTMSLWYYQWYDRHT